jgi:hypothetical protein
MRPWIIWGTAACLVTGCPLEPLTVTGFGVSSSVIRPGSMGSGSLVTVSVPGIKGADTAGLTALLNGVPVPVVASRDGEVSIRMPPGWQGDVARFDLWRNGERITSRDIAALLAQGAKVSPTDGVTVRTNGETTSTTPLGSGGVTINITVPAGSTTGGGGTTVVTSGGTGTGSGSGSGTPTASPTPVPTATPLPTPTPAVTPTPAPTLVPVVDQTPVPGGTGEVQGHVAF